MGVCGCFLVEVVFVVGIVVVVFIVEVVVVFVVVGKIVMFVVVGGRMGRVVFVGVCFVDCEGVVVYVEVVEFLDDVLCIFRRSYVDESEVVGVVGEFVED